MSRELTLADLSDPRERAFVAAIFELGGPQHAPEAALRAGYASGDYAQAERAAAFLMGAKRIRDAINGEIRARFDGGAVVALETLLEICANKKAPANARISAAQEILNRSSIGPVPSRSVNIQADGIEAWLDKLDAAERAKTIDVEATEVGGTYAAVTEGA